MLRTGKVEIYDVLSWAVPWSSALLFVSLLEILVLREPGTRSQQWHLSYSFTFSKSSQALIYEPTV